MHPNRYHYWQKRLRIAAVAEIQTEKIEIAQSPPAGWMQVSASAEVNEPKKPKDAGIMIEIGKSRVNANEATDMELLKKICKMLVELC